MLAYHIDPSRRLAITRVSGALSAVRLADFLPKLFRDPKFDPTFDAMVVAMDVEAVPSRAAAAMLAPLVRSWSTRRSGARWAFVLPDEAARQAAEMAIAEVRLTAVTTHCFISEAAAAAWLASLPAVTPATTPAAI